MNSVEMKKKKKNEDGSIRSAGSDRGGCIVVERAGAHHHHDLKLVEADCAIPVAVNAADHLAALPDGTLLTEALQNLVQLLRGNRPIPVDVVHREGLPQVLHYLVRVHTFGVQLDKLVEVDMTIPVRVHLSYHLLKLLLRL